MSSALLSDFLRENSISAEMQSLPDSTSTVADAANALGVTPDHIVKSVLLVADSVPVLVIACGTSRIDTKAVASHLGVSKKRVKLADPVTVREVTGFDVGGVPPFGHKSSIRTLIDNRVLSLSWVYAGGGVSNKVLKLSIADILRATGAEPVNLSPVASESG